LTSAPKFIVWTSVSTVSVITTSVEVPLWDIRDVCAFIDIVPDDKEVDCTAPLVSK